MRKLGWTTTRLKVLLVMALLGIDARNVLISVPSRPPLKLVMEKMMFKDIYQNGIKVGTVYTPTPSNGDAE